MQQEKINQQRTNQLEVIKFVDDTGDEDTLLVVTKTPSKGTPGQPNLQSISSIENGGSNN